MALNNVFGAGLSALQAAQAGMRVASQNIANVNTPGYVRTAVDLEANAAVGGVTVAGVRRAADQFLAAAAVNATANQGSAAALSDLMDRAQAAFGDPTSDASIFAQLDTVFTRFTELASDPSNGLRRYNAVSATQTALGAISTLGQQLGALRLEADQRIGEQVGRVNDLMSRIAAYNDQIIRLRGNGADSSSAESAQAQLIDQLSSYIDVRVTQKDTGAAEVRTPAGALLISDVAVTLKHNPIDGAYDGGDALEYIDRNGASHSMAGLIRSGSLAGLVMARDQELPALQEALGQLASSTADALNAVHNDNTTVPAQNVLQGRQTGLLAGDLLNFTGKATFAVTSQAGDLTRTVSVDFGAGTYSVNGGAAVAYPGPATTMAQFATAMNTALGGDATMAFANGAMTMTGAGTNGVFVQQDATTPSSRAGRGFSQFFGLNDLVVSNTPTFFDTGLAGAEAHGLAGGGALSFRVLDANGREVLARSVGVAGTTWNDMLTALNASGTGLGGYGAFSMNANGALNATMAQGYTIEVTGDTTMRGSTGLSMSDLFGLTNGA
ncbi:MAG: flagellar hook-associated protein FlgK, partial [Hyphomonadaceae bacterium]